MKVGILGSGSVGQTVGTGFIKLGHEVKIGTRDPQKLQEWVAQNGAHASAGSFAEAAVFGDIVVLATLWSGTENVLQMAGESNTAGKIVIDITNPLQFGPEGPSLALGFSDSGGEQIQRWLPAAKVVKALNHVPAPVMIQADLLGETADLFICGNDQAAKETVTELMGQFGWPVIDLGGIEQARLTEALTGLWIRYYVLTQSWQHAFKLVRPGK